MGIGYALTGFFALFIPFGAYEMTGRNPLATVVLLWVTFCCTWMIMAALGKPQDEHAQLLDEISRWGHDDAM